MSKATRPAQYQHIAARVFDRPLLIEHRKLLAILNVLGPRLGFELSGDQRSMMDDDYSSPPDPFAHLEHFQALGIELEPMNEGHFVGEGVAIIPVSGTLVQKSDWMSDASGMTSYGRIEKMVDAAEDDRRVREVLWEFDTPGGEVAGAFDFSDRIYDMRTHGAKPMTAVVNELAASAGYLLASSVGNIVVNRTGAVGSIGVVAAHSDYSKAMEKRGVVVTLIYAGDNKVLGNPYEPLSDAAREDWQREVDSVYALFTETVARNLGWSVNGQQRARDTKASVFTGRSAIDAGLALRSNTFTNEFHAAMARAKESQRRSPWQYAQSDSTSQEMTMTKEQLEAKQKEEAEAKAKMEAEAKAKVEAEQRAAAEAEAKAKADAEARAKADAQAAGATSVADAVKAERARGTAIMALPEANGREALAQTCIAQGLTVEASKAMLAASPKVNALNNAMERGGTPGIRSDSDATTEQAPKLHSVEETLEFRRGIFNGSNARAAARR